MKWWKIFLEAHVQYPENLYNLYSDLTIFPERMKINKVEKLVANSMINKNMLYT